MLYDVLGVPRTADLAELRTAFRQCALRSHPDKGGNEQAFQQVYEAFRMLSDPARREQYDATSSAQVNQRTALEPTSCQERQYPSHSSKRQRSKGSCSERKAQPRNGNRPDGSAEHKNKQSGPDLTRLVSLIRQLSPPSRKHVLSCQLAETERFQLKQWMQAQCELPTYNQLGAHKQQNHKKKSMPHHAFQSDTADMADIMTDSSQTDSECEASPKALAIWDDTTLDTDRNSCCEDQRAFRKGIRITQGGYIARTTCRFVYLSSKTTKDLDVAIEWLMILLAIANALRTTFYQDNCLRKAVEQTCSDLGVKSESIGLGLHFEMCGRYWLGQRHKICSPTMHCLEQAGSAMQRLTACYYLGSQGQSAGRAKGYSEWCKLKAAYLDICEQGGWNRQVVQERLQKMESARAVQRRSTCDKRIKASLESWRQQVRRVQEEAAKQAAADRKARWRRMNRPDITMAEILGGDNQN